MNEPRTVGTKHEMLYRLVAIQTMFNFEKKKTQQFMRMGADMNHGCTKREPIEGSPQSKFLIFTKFPIEI